MGFDLSAYEPVEDRLRRFWADHPDGRVLTFLEERDAGRYIVRAEVYSDRDDDRPRATGWAEERSSDRGVNATSAAENCETSATGRALAQFGYAPKGARPSREEMEISAGGAQATRGRGAPLGHDTAPPPASTSPASSESKAKRSSQTAPAAGDTSSGGGGLTQGEGAAASSPEDPRELLKPHFGSFARALKTARDRYGTDITRIMDLTEDQARELLKQEVPA